MLHGHRRFHSPLGVAVLDNVKLALSKGVPELDGSVSGGRDDLTVVSRERDATLPNQFFFSQMLSMFSKTHERTSPVWPTNFLVVKPVLRSHNLRVWSQEEERANWPSEEMATSDTKWL